MVYAGAAGGGHIELLKILFPGIEFELYDPRRFDIKPDQNTRIHREFLTDMTAQYWATQGRPILFICDIRNCVRTCPNATQPMKKQKNKF